jgi:hypothetical protein
MSISHVSPRNVADPDVMDTMLIATFIALAGLILLAVGIRLAGHASAAADALGVTAPAVSPGRGTAHRQAHPHLRRPAPLRSRAHAFDLS